MQLHQEHNLQQIQYGYLLAVPLVWEYPGAKTITQKKRPALTCSVGCAVA